MTPIKPIKSDGSLYPKEELPSAIAIQGQEIHNQEITVQRPDGTLFPVLASAAPIRDKQGKVVAAMINFQDISKRKQTEETLMLQSMLIRGSNKILQEALSVRTEEELGKVCLNVAQEVTGSKFGFIGEINKKWLQNIAISNPSLEICVMTDKSGHRQLPADMPIKGIYGRVLIDGKGFFTNNPESHPDSTGFPKGHPHLQSFMGVPLVSNKKAVGMIAVANRKNGYSQVELESLETLAPVIVEAFARKRAEEKLEKLNATLEERVHNQTVEVSLEREYLFCVLESLPVMICLLTKDHRIAFANKMFREKFGDAEDKPCFEYFFGFSSQCKWCEAYTVLKTGKPHYWQFESPSGTVLNVYDSPFRNTDGSMMVLEVDIDVTEHVKMEKQLKEKDRLAVIGATAGMVGHDIRNPLQAMLSDIYLLKSYITMMPEIETKKDVVESLDGIEKNISYVNKIVADLQDYARPLNPEKVEIDIANIVCSVFKTVFVPENVKVSIEIENLHSPSSLKSDPLFIRRALTNLVTNAVQAMPKGGKLVITATETKQDVLINVEDTGVGIPSEVKPKLFTPMLTTKSKGQGLGLAVVKRLVEALGGKVSFESERDKGTIFTICLHKEK
jgi:nitrogen-specific signal transduction histidine kinase